MKAKEGMGWGKKVVCDEYKDRQCRNRRESGCSMRTQSFGVGSARIQVCYALQQPLTPVGMSRRQQRQAGRTATRIFHH